MYYVMPSFITPASGAIAIGNTGSIVEGAINALFVLLFDKFILVIAVFFSNAI